MSDPIMSFDESALKTFPATFEFLEEQGVLTPTITLDALRTLLSAGQRAIVDQIIDLKPQDYGVKTPYAGDLEPVPADLMKVCGQQYIEHGERKTIGEKYIPRHIFEAYVHMNEAFMAGQPNRQLLIASCYRSPAYQVAVFIDWLINAYHGDIAKTIRHASPPNYSQHTIASKAAIDFKNVDGSPSDYHPEDFRDTVEYAWLRRHGGEFGFYESWLENNEFGMRAEPWHWQFRPGRSYLHSYPATSKGAHLSLVTSKRNSDSSTAGKHSDKQSSAQTTTDGQG
ncbi:MAG TPA: D-alanyl-D-alanine carboxypeptidase family protein [Trebonia sp.]